MLKSSITFAALVFGVALSVAAPAQAQTVMQQCGQQYQAAKAGGTLNGQTWNQYRTECAARLKVTPASVTTPNAAPAPVAPPPAAPKPTTAAAPAPAPMPKPATPIVATGKPAAPVSGGRAAMLTRQKQCGAEWRAQKVSLVAQTPGLTWPKYWSACNTRLKAAGQ